MHRYGQEAKILSGGHSLIPMMQLRFAAPEYMVDINGIPGLDYIVVEYKIERIYFCCDGSKVKFEAEPEKYVKATAS